MTDHPETGVASIESLLVKPIIFVIACVLFAVFVVPRLPDRSTTIPSAEEMAQNKAFIQKCIDKGGNYWPGDGKMVKNLCYLNAKIEDDYSNSPDDTPAFAAAARHSENGLPVKVYDQAFDYPMMPAITIKNCNKNNNCRVVLNKHSIVIKMREGYNFTASDSGGVIIYQSQVLR